MELKIEYLPVDKITPYENNTRKHEEKSIESIKESIQRYGFDDPIGVWGEDNIIVEGHGRLEASKQLGMEKVPVIRLDHLTDEERREYAIAHNRTTEFSKWDFAKLEDELESLEADMGAFDLYATQPLDLEDDYNSDIEEDYGEEDNKIMCHCPKCGFYFEVKK